MGEPFPSRPTLIWDGDCSFCRRWIERWKKLTGDAIDYQPYQRIADKLPGISRAQFAQAVYLAEPDGRITRAAEAVFRSLALAGRQRYLLRLYAHVPPFRWLSEFAYRIVARHRGFFDRLDVRLLGGDAADTCRRR